MRTRLACLFALTVLPLSGLAGAAESPTARPRNVVILYADDWRHDTLGVAGHPILQTPHLDQLAREGLRFTHACVTTPICGVSRASLLTGQWMSRHGARAFEMFQTPWAETYPGRLRASGYWVGHVGKWHNGRFPTNAFDFGRSYSGTHWLKQPDGTRIHVTQKNERDALEFLRTRPTNQPFCLTLAFFAPHAEDNHPEQYRPQPASLALYTNVTVPLPATATAEALRRRPPFLQQATNESRVRWRWRFDSPEKYQAMMKNYYRLCTEVDAACGRVLKELSRQGVLDDTLVIFTGDNGYFHGEHQFADKWYAYEESIRVPLLIRDPRLPASRRGGTNDAFVLNVDLAPTLLALAGVAVPETMQGRDLAPLYLAAVPPPWRTEFFMEHATITSKFRIPASEALVGKDVKYIVWPEWDTEELFDLTTDSQEQHNLIADPAHATRLAALRARFAELKAAAR